MKYTLLTYKNSNGRYIKYMGRGDTTQAIQELINFCESIGFKLIEARIIITGVGYDFAYNFMQNSINITNGDIVYSKQ